MEAVRIAGHSPHEGVFGFSRVVRAGPHAHVAGTAPIPADGSEPPADAYGQARLCLEIVLDALAKAGGSAADVVRTRMYLVRRTDWEDVARAHNEVFADLRPAATAVVVGGLLDERWLVEIEAEAYIAGAGETEPR